ncbi:hypothetical protein QJS04_geneDACA002510 [Acorus gramineus]|uniref:Uncharacterized protein n=1 Tax=Acorus gramineus TaxID=55184 RepID=A0AAV9AQI0_ACOGR|nr:hypothetical protein QJS04_geneDACA002510 [Acorus gramineus]
MDSVNGSKHRPTTTNTDEEPILQSPSKNSKPKKDKSGLRSSSSSDDFIQLEDSELAKSPRPNPDPPQLASPDAKQSPPAVQSMARSDETPDPNRIPSSIFNRSKSTTPQEWSVASNESLFSIHVGNSSFSRDHIILFGKSGELGSLPDYPLGLEGGGGPGGEGLEALPLSSPPGEVGMLKTEAMKEALRVGVEESKMGEGARVEAEKVSVTPRSESSTSRSSDGSGTSTKSFAFPILTGDATKIGSIKAQSHHHRNQQPTMSPTAETPGGAATPNADKNWWCSWFSCCSFCS